MPENYSLPEFFLNMLKEQYGEELTKNMIKGYEVKRPVTFRVNTLKTSIEAVEEALQKEGIVYERVNWSKEAFVIKNAQESDIEKLEIYQKGEIYLQSLSSMLPPILLQPQQGADILDMAAAPGGKTTQMAALSENKAHITACELHPIRAERLKYNIQKQGASCVYVMNIDARRMDSFFSFDQILLDAPCSGSGTLNIKDNNIQKYFTPKLIEKVTASQLALLKKAITMLKPGKEMIYSTCSILSCENEDMLQKVLNKMNAEIVPITWEGIEELPLLPTKIEGTIVVCPNELFEGFFLAKIRKKE